MGTPKIKSFMFTSFHFKVGSWIKPCIKVRDSALGDAIHILKANLTDFLSKAGTPYSSTNLLQVCRAVNGANADFRSDFGNGKREASIKLPCQALHEDHLKTIDSCKFIMKCDR